MYTNGDGAVVFERKMGLSWFLLPFWRCVFVLAPFEGGGGEFEEEERGFSTNRTFSGECCLFFASCTHAAKRAERDVVAKG